MKMVSFLLIAVLLVVAVVGCGTFNGAGRDLEGLGQAMREVSQPAVNAQNTARIERAILDFRAGQGVVRDDR